MTPSGSPAPAGVSPDLRIRTAPAPVALAPLPIVLRGVLGVLIGLLLYGVIRLLTGWRYNVVLPPWAALSRHLA